MEQRFYIKFFFFFFFVYTVYVLIREELVFHREVEMMNPQPREDLKEFLLGNELS